MGNALHNGLGGEKAFHENLKDITTVFLLRNAIDALLKIVEGGERVKDACRDPVSRFDVLGGHQFPLDGEIPADSGIIAGHSRHLPWKISSAHEGHCLTCHPVSDGFPKRYSWSDAKSRMRWPRNSSRFTYREMAEEARFENTEASETIGLDLISSFHFQSLTEESRQGGTH